MKKIFIVVTLLIFPLNMLFADPPTLMNCSLKSPSPNNYNISLFIVHDVERSTVKDEKVHFVKTVTIQVNGIEIKTISPVPQKYPKIQGEYPLGKLKEGDKILITATCSLGGEKTQEIIIKRQRGLK
jgi:hypothetical protein